MATVTGLTAARMLAIEAESIVGGAVNPVNGHLILTRHDGSTIDAGPVVSTGDFVDVITNQIVDGVKTFSSAPVVPANAFPESAIANLVTDLGAKALDSAAVHKTGAETIAGVKTFSSSPVVPAGAFPESAVANLVTDLSRYVICSSSTRPGSPFVGQRIFETDTGREYAWMGSVWSYRLGGDNPTYVRAYRASALNAVGGWSTIDLDGEVYDYGNNHTASGGYICPETRMYDLSARVRINANNDPQQFIIGLSVGGVDGQIAGSEITGHAMVGGENFSLVLATQIPLNVGQSIKLQVYNGQSGVCPVTASAIDTWMAIRAV